MPLKSNSQDAAVDIAKALRDVFKKYTYQTRKKVMETLERGKGKKEVEQLIIHPDRPLSFFRRLSFKDWMANKKKK